MANSPCADKGFSGSVPSPAQRCLICSAYGPENCPPVLCGSVGNRSLELLGTCTGSSLSPLRPRLLWPPSRESLAEVSMQNCQDQRPLQSTSVRRRLESMDLGSGELNPFVETRRPIGTVFGQPPSPEISLLSPRRSEWVIMGTSEELVLISHRLRRLFERRMCSGVRLGLESHVVPGTNLEFKLIASVQGQNFGTATRVCFS